MNQGICQILSETRQAGCCRLLSFGVGGRWSSELIQIHLTDFSQEQLLRRLDGPSDLSSGSVTSQLSTVRGSPVQASVFCQTFNRGVNFQGTSGQGSEAAPLSHPCVFPSTGLLLPLLMHRFLNRSMPERWKINPDGLPCP